MSQVLAVFGATGLQGSSVITSVLNDTELSKKYTLRAITRDPTSGKAQKLATQNVEVVQGDVSDRGSLDKALNGVHTVFLMTVPDFSKPPDAEFEAAKNVADACLEKGVQYIIFSTLPCVSEISGGTYTNLAMFDVKARAERYIRGLPIKSAFFSPGSFMENYITVAAPKRAEDGTYILAQHLAPSTRIPLIDAADDTGKFIGAILNSPEKYVGEIVYGAERMYSLEEIVRTMGNVTGKDVVYKQVSVEEYKASVPFGGDIIAQALSYFEEFGYYGERTEELVASTAGRGALTSFEEFLEKRQFKLV